MAQEAPVFPTGRTSYPIRRVIRGLKPFRNETRRNHEGYYRRRDGCAQ